MANNLAICTTYFIEMLIAYIFFSQIGEKKYNIWCCCLIGTAVFEVGALSDIVFSNTIWINALMFIIINFFFALFCFNIKTTKILFYSIILDIFSTALEFAAIFLISTLTNTQVTEYVDNLTFFIIDVSISKILYFITCLILSALVKKENSNVKIPVALYFYPIVITLALVVFWSICANYELNNTHQVLLSVTSLLMFFSTVILFIVYLNNVAKENQYLIIKQEMEKTNIDKKFYDILEQQNNELMIYAHDTKNHLNAIKALNNNKQIDEYLTLDTTELLLKHEKMLCIILGVDVAQDSKIPLIENPVERLQMIFKEHFYKKESESGYEKVMQYIIKDTALSAAQIEQLRKAVEAKMPSEDVLEMAQNRKDVMEIRRCIEFYEMMRQKEESKDKSKKSRRDSR